MKISKHYKEPEKTPTIISGVFFHYDKPNKNGRVYTKEVCEEMVKQFGELTHPMYGELNPSYDFADNLEKMKVSHIVKEIHINKEEKTLDGTIELLDTPNGRLINELIKSKIPISIASRAYGDIDPITKQIKSDTYKLLSFDIMPQMESAFDSNLKLSNAKPLTMDDL